MLEALGRKLNCLGSEDALTASVFGLLRYLPQNMLVAWLSQAQPASADAKAADMQWIHLPQLTEAYFWPQYEDTLKQYGRVEPDVVLEFGRVAVIIEAKLRSGKTPAVMPGEMGEEQEADQLARQVKATVDFYGRNKRGGIEVGALVYVTADVTPPELELDKSVKAIERLGLQAAPPLYWLSWSALGQLLEQQRARGEFPGHLIAADLLEYMQEADVLRFSGWRIGDGTGSVDWRYQARTERYFSGIPWQDPGSAWTYRETQEEKR